MTDSSKSHETSETSDLVGVSHQLAAADCQSSDLIGDHWLEMTATIPVQRTEDFAAWMDRQLALAESELSIYASARSTSSNR